MNPGFDEPTSSHENRPFCPNQIQTKALSPVEYLPDGLEKFEVDHRFQEISFYPQGQGLFLQKSGTMSSTHDNRY